MPCQQTIVGSQMVAFTFIDIEIWHLINFFGLDRIGPYYKCSKVHVHGPLVSAVARHQNCFYTILWHTESYVGRRWVWDAYNKAETPESWNLMMKENDLQCCSGHLLCIKWINLLPSFIVAHVCQAMDTGRYISTVLFSIQVFFFRLFWLYIFWFLFCFLARIALKGRHMFSSLVCSGYVAIWTMKNMLLH